MFRKIRIAILLYVLLLVAATQFLTQKRSTDWNEPLWVDVWLLAADSADATARYLTEVKPDAHDAIEQFFAAEARRHGLDQPMPFRINVAGILNDTLPELPPPGGWLASVRFSLALRWFVTRLHWSDDRPTPDITVFALYHSATAGPTLDRSIALRKGMVALANLFASRRMQGSNQIVVAHELLHTLGATDKYDPRTNLPLAPIGLAAPERKPMYPQSQAELMAGRIARSLLDADIPTDLDQVVIGPATAYEIGWIDALPSD